MTPDFKYNHDAKDFNEAIGVADNFQQETIDKLNVLVNTLNKEDRLKQSIMIEEMIAICSDEQIAFVASLFIKQQIDHQREQKKHKS